MSDTPLLLVIFDLLGIFVFATAGALVGVRKEFDVFGVLVLAGTTGLGGGFLRDVLIGAAPPAALSDWRYLIVPVAAGLMTFTFHSTLGRISTPSTCSTPSGWPCSVSPGPSRRPTTAWGRFRPR